ncbi:MAG: helix-turn-helix transcriptional regulator [Provencibacterium sp.]|jgi:transcriptional regulator with XRE-family HTH domain|nr:helix-turn-helix transcriptional regulator [Provencibacterium sp.]
MKQDSESYYKTCRVLAGLTQEAAAELLHVSERSLSAYENGAEVPEDIVDRMSQAYNSPLLACWHMKHHNVLGKYLPDVFDPATNGDMAFQLIIARDDLDPATEIIKEIMRDLVVDEQERPALADQLEILRRVAGQIMSAVIYGEKLCREGGGDNACCSKDCQSCQTADCLHGRSQPFLPGTGYVSRLPHPQRAAGAAHDRRHEGGPCRV